MVRYILHMIRVIVVAGLAGGAGCTAGAEPKGRSVSEAWEATAAASRQTSTVRAGGKAQVDGRPVATVNGRPIDRRQFMTLLAESHGLALLQQMMVLELAKQATAKQGLQVSPGDVEAEYKRRLERLYQPDSAEPDKLSQQQQERALTLILDREGISRQEFMLKVERDAHVRKLAEKELKIDEEAIRREYEVLYGPKVQLRLIVCGSPRQAEQVQELLAAGEDFASVARAHSKDRHTAAEGGLTPAFSLADDAIPTALREAARQLEAADGFRTVRLGQDYAVIEKVRTLPAGNVRYENVRDRVLAVYRRRVMDKLMISVISRLIGEAKVAIFDPVLREQYRQRRIDTGGQAPALIND